MKKSIRITILKPCEKQEWSSEFFSNKEKLCLLCSEKVYDATGLTDTELHKLVSQKNRPKCMKFKQSQLNRPITVSTTTNQFNYKQISNAFYGLLVAGLVVSCSTNHKIQQNSLKNEDAFVIDPIHKDLLFFTIEGVVVETKQNKPIVNAEVSFVETNFKTFTDDKGHFDFFLSSNFLKEKMSFEIIAKENNVTYVGYVRFTKNDLPKLDTIKVKRMDIIRLGHYEVEK